MFYRLSKLLEFRKKHSASRRIFNSLLGVWMSRWNSVSRVWCNISKTSASVSSGFPNTKKLMKARGRRPRAFIVFEYLETPMKHEAQIACQSCIINQEQWKKFSLILASYAEYKLLLFILFFSNYWLLLSNILAVSQAPEDRHCLKRNTHTSLNLNTVILNEIWRWQWLHHPRKVKALFFVSGRRSDRL